MTAREESTGVPRQQRKCVLLVVEDQQGYEYLLYKIDLKDLFYPAVLASVAVPRGHATDVRRLPDPMAQFKTLGTAPERIDFTLIGGGSTLIGLSNLRRTIVHDTASGVSSAGPELQHDKPSGTFVVPLGGCLLVLRARPGRGGETPFAEVLPAGGGGWRAIPDPPRDFISLTWSKPGCQVTSYVAAGARVWLSAEDRGTYSLKGTAWRKEGDWELPFHGRGLFVPELGAGLCFGLCPLAGRLCAWDIRQSPPAVRYAWDDTMPRWLPEVGLDLFSVARYPEGTLAYLGDGKFCIAWTLALNHRARIIQRAAHLMGVKVSKTSGGRLRMVRHKVCFYELPSHTRMAYALHAHPDAPCLQQPTEANLDGCDQLVPEPIFRDQSCSVDEERQ
jgi:hypothetical protein